MSIQDKTQEVEHVGSSSGPAEAPRRPEGWEESDDEAELTENLELSDEVPAYGWLKLDTWAAACTGLHVSKYDWAITEHRIQEEADLHDLANDKFDDDHAADEMEMGASSSQLVAPVSPAPPTQQLAAYYEQMQSTA